MMTMALLLRSSLAPLACLALLAACGDKGGDNSLAALDAQLTNNTADPAVRAAVEAPIAVDPDLTAQSNRHTARPADKPLDGAVPQGLGTRPAAADVERAAGGRLMSAPEAVAMRESREEAVTLGALARQQRSGTSTRKRGCREPRVSYAMDWAQRLPAAFPLYPGAQLTEAAGNDNGACSLRAVSFTTSAPLDDVVDFYYTTARRANFDAERQSGRGQEVLGGTRASDEAAYYISLEPMRGGGTSVDLIVNGGF